MARTSLPRADVAVVRTSRPPYDQSSIETSMEMEEAGLEEPRRDLLAGDSVLAAGAIGEAPQDLLVARPESQQALDVPLSGLVSRAPYMFGKWHADHGHSLAPDI